MQEPFKLTKGMQDEIDDELTQVLESAHDPARTRPSSASSLRRPLNTLHSDSAAPGPADDQSPVEDAINPSHYRKHPSGIECIEVTRHMNFNVGNAIKYIWRHLDKDDPIENLKKAQWYIDDEIRRLQGQR